MANYERVKAYRNLVTHVINTYYEKKSKLNALVQKTRDDMVKKKEIESRIKLSEQLQDKIESFRRNFTSTIIADDVYGTVTVTNPGYSPLDIGRDSYHYETRVVDHRYEPVNPFVKECIENLKHLSPEEIKKPKNHTYFVEKVNTLDIVKYFAEKVDVEQLKTERAKIEKELNDLLPKTDAMTKDLREDYRKDCQDRANDWSGRIDKVEKQLSEYRIKIESKEEKRKRRFRKNYRLDQDRDIEKLEKQLESLKGERELSINELNRVDKDSVGDLLFIAPYRGLWAGELEAAVSRQKELTTVLNSYDTCIDMVRQAKEITNERNEELKSFGPDVELLNKTSDMIISQMADKVILSGFDSKEIAINYEYGHKVYMSCDRVRDIISEAVSPEQVEELMNNPLFLNNFAIEFKGNRSLRDSNEWYDRRNLNEDDVEYLLCEHLWKEIDKNIAKAPKVTTTGDDGRC